jgi:dienelactone hydrolase/pimeloyl-ACP methyl ester carboxylesterase
MRKVAIILTLILTGAARAQEDLTVLQAEGDLSPKKMLHAWLLAEAQKQFDARRAAVAMLKTPADIEKRQQELRAKFIESIGGFPEKTPLNPRVVGTEKRDGYRIEKVIFESRPNHHVTATLYLPEGKPPYPGVINPIGHSTNGKAADSIQRGCILLAKNGIAALAYDPIGQGERRQLIEEAKGGLGGGTNEHTMTGVGALLVGRQTASYRIWDGIRSLDYLAGRPEIDPKRLGCTGCSGGGTLTSYLMALDDRILCAAPSCYITTLEKLFATIGPQDAEQNITGQVAFGMEHADYLTLHAPKPTLLLTATRDFFNIDGAWTTFREAKRIYGVLGHGERVDLFEYDTGHGFPKPQREAMVRWMRRWLLDRDDAVTEPDFALAKEADLLCTRTGQVLEDLKGRSVFDLNAERAGELARERRRWQGEEMKDRLLTEVRRLLALPAAVREAKMRKAGVVKRPQYEVRKLVFETEPGVLVPGLWFGKGSEAKAPLVLYLHEDGKQADAAPGGSIEKLVQAGRSVLALDLRGMGETAPGKPGTSRPNYFGVEYKETFLSLHLNRPLLGQRVRDVLSVIEKLAPETPGGFHVVGIGTAAPSALHAAALEPRIKEVELRRCVMSWESVVRTPISHNQLVNAVPGALAVYDLPELAATLAPRSLTVQAVSATGKAVEQEALTAAWSPAARAYAQHKAEKDLVIRP